MGKKEDKDNAIRYNINLKNRVRQLEEKLSEIKKDGIKMKLLKMIKRKKLKRDYIRGFEWAMVEMFIVGTPLETVNDRIYNPFDANNFEKGAKYAVRIAYELPNSRIESIFEILDKEDKQHDTH